ncbi:TonB-dependent receptor [Hyphomonas sp.]|uniref:TonB-dependent receptor n=1 Tax=Hyphomonas sp. TaxID=87 RepID=UPI003527D6AC
MNSGNRLLLAGTVGVSALCFAMPAIAQEAAPADEQARLNTVVVTAQRREQNVDDIGVAISAFDGAQLEALGVEDVGDLAMITPGFSQTDTGVTGVPVYTIRGVGFDDYSSNSTSTVGVYQDEVNLPYPTMTREPQFDIQRVEILKGPQGTLYGRNTTGGAINLISKRPTRDLEAGAKLGYSRFSTFDAEGYVSGPLSDRVRFRLAGTTTQSEKGWQKSSSRPGDTLGKQDKLAGRAMLEWDESDSVSVLLKAHGYRDKSDNPAPQYFAYVPLVPDLAIYFPPPAEADLPDLTDPRSADWSATLRPKRDNEGWGASANVSWDIGDMTLTSVSAYESFDRHESNDWDGTSIENLDVIFDTSIDAYSQELRLAGEASDSLSWVLGGYYSKDEVDESWLALGSESTIYLGLFGAVDTRYTQDTETAALFAHTEWMMTPDWRWTFGLRYTQEDRDWAGCSYDVDGGLSYLYNQLDSGPIPGFADSFFLSSTPLQMGDCATINPADASYEVDAGTGAVTVYGGSSGVFRDSSSYDNLSGKIGLDWKPSDDLLVYGSVSRGFKSGGYNGAAASSWVQLAPYKEEQLTAYETGVKTTVADGRVRINGALFYYDYEDKQIIGNIADDVFGLLTQILNVPKSNIKGAEADIEWQATPELYFRFGGSWLESNVKEFMGLDGVGVLQNFKDHSLPQTPTWQLNGMTEYRRPILNGLYGRIGADFAYSSDYQASVDTSPLFYVDDYFVWNAHMGFGAENDSWEVLLWGRNMSDTYYYTSSNIADDYWFRTPGMGRTWGVQLNVKY